MAVDKIGCCPVPTRRRSAASSPSSAASLEEYGGDAMLVDISAKQNLHVDKLLEAVLLTADAELDLRANPDMDARGATVEARLDKGRGAVATVLVQQGTLHVGDAIVAGTSYGQRSVPCSTRTVSRWKRPVRPHLFRCWA